MGKQAAYLATQRGDLINRQIANVVVTLPAIRESAAITINLIAYFRSTYPAGHTNEGWHGTAHRHYHMRGAAARFLFLAPLSLKPQEKEE